MTEEVRLAELVGGLSVVSDAGKGLDDGQGLRTCVLAVNLARELGFADRDVETTFWIGLLRFVGCTATASEMAAALGDELAVGATFSTVDSHDPRDMLRGAINSVGHRPDRVVGFLRRAPAVVHEHEVASCEIAQAVARQLGLPDAVAAGLGQVFERWDGKGNPGERSGDQLSRPVRVWQIAHVADLLAASVGAARAGIEIRHRGGSAFDPELAQACGALLPKLLNERSGIGYLGDVLDCEPTPHRMVSDAALDTVLAVFGLLADLKSPHFRGHSERVAALVAVAAAAAGRSAEEIEAVRRAGLVHDVGRVAVSSRIWDRPGELSEAERDQIERYPYHTQRMLARVPALADLMDIACAPEQRTVNGLAALVAAADRYVSAGETRPYRPAHSDAERATLLRSDVVDGRLSVSAVDAVLAAAGELPGRPTRTAGPLTDGERDVLALVAKGLSNAAVARRLAISPKTVTAQLYQAYAKLGVSTRASAVVIATQRGWLDIG